MKDWKGIYKRKKQRAGRRCRKCNKVISPTAVRFCLKCARGKGFNRKEWGKKYQHFKDVVANKHCKYCGCLLWFDNKAGYCKTHMRKEFKNAANR